MVSELNVLMLIGGHVGSMFFFGKKKEASEQKKNPENIDTSMLCKFVVDGAGKRIGESVSVASDMLIIKSGSQFLGVPLKHVESVEKTLVVKGVFDFTKAYELGEKWRKDSFKEMNAHGSPEKESQRL